jgi:uncharacterized protein (DUF952 family)
VGELIYKIFRADEWAAFEAEGRFEGSEADRQDGFIHFSKLDQLRETLSKHYSGEMRVAIAAFPADAFGQDLKWEVSRGGEKFPHLYAPLLIAQAGKAEWVDPRAPLESVGGIALR